ncbi:hypothetical protein RV11_GL001121 [Enterococcus phoeniculicola]|nr:hypothetical protein RV11_GL001121 [Enterococcus phoeniculicola]
MWDEKKYRQVKREKFYYEEPPYDDGFDEERYEFDYDYQYDYRH